MQTPILTVIDTCISFWDSLSSQCDRQRRDSIFVILLTILVILLRTLCCTVDNVIIVGLSVSDGRRVPFGKVSRGVDGVPADPSVPPCQTWHPQQRGGGEYSSQLCRCVGVQFVTAVCWSIWPVAVKRVQHAATSSKHEPSQSSGNDVRSIVILSSLRSSVSVTSFACNFVTFSVLMFICWERYG